MKEHATLTETINGNGFPNVYVYAYRGHLFGTHKSWRSSPAEWIIMERTETGNFVPPDAGGITFRSWSTVTTRKRAIALAEYTIDALLDRPVTA